ncbi:alpha/beta hydrolase [Streptomyces subrutilus]|uniref:Alpha/beta hydrolase n=1 Tax=Streptomyces subrutilus TaxID=36818 RepID=A0A5P2UPB6_9ACTN|nr:alpha/beta hydrolase [Streptomyces subrutilus]QEU79384.1 alpha/beta hydrolase [Streptomyces subrutilus]WSJ31419.1 alpha/beta hydrolase [Streptomyces subrutilus]
MGVAVGCALLVAGLAPAAAPGAAGGPAPAGVGAAAARAAVDRDGPAGRLHGQRVRWGACARREVPAGMRCGTVEVPLDHADPAKGTIRVAVARIPATDPARRIGSLLLNFGGPGAQGVAGLAADARDFAELGERYDLVSFDPRGVGHSAPVSCAGSQDTAGEADDAAAQLAALRAVVRRCELASGPVLPYVGTVHVARDMDLLRRALGDAKLHYLGFSYGTRLGAAYAALFPRTTGRMVLDGVDTLGEPLSEQALVTARGQQRALDHFLTWCTHRPGCVYGTNARTAGERVDALIARLDREPLVGGDGSYVTGQDAVASIGSALYARGSWPALADALALAERRSDPVGLLQLGGPTDPAEDGDPDAGEPAPGTGPGSVPADNAAAALAAVNCADDPDRSAAGASPAAVQRELAELRPAFLQASKVFGPRQLRTVLSCYGRPPGTDFLRRIDHPGAPRMLLVGTRGDPATPYEWTEETARRLGSAVVLDHKGDGHTGYDASACVRAYAHRFLVDGRLPNGTRSCPAGE